MDRVTNRPLSVANIFDAITGADGAKRLQTVNADIAKTRTALDEVRAALNNPANTTPDVPSDSAVVPGDTTPTPTALAAWSPPPATTGVPARRPVAAAAWSLTAPVTCGPSNVGGSQSRGIANADRTSPDQSRAAKSNRIVPEPSALSMA